MKNKGAFYITHSAVIASLYVLLTYLSSLAGLSSGVIQIRLSEALTVLPAFTPAAIPGLFIGCLIANLLTGAVLWDVIFGSIATLIGAIFTYILRKKSKYLAVIPPIAANTAIIPFVLIYAYGTQSALPFIILTVFIGELLSCGVLGVILYNGLSSPYIRNHF